MNFGRCLHTVETHTAGESTRIVVAGLPLLRGATVMDKKEYARRHCDAVRRLLIHEPRGHADMFGAYLVPPGARGADYGAIFIDSGGYLNMCGHGTIGVATMLLEMGYFSPLVEPVTTLRLETPAGVIPVEAAVSGGRVTSVSFTNVPAFVERENCALDVPGVGTVRFDIAFGGSFFALVEAAGLGLEVCKENVARFRAIALPLLDAVNRACRVSHPLLPINTVDLVEFYQETGGGARNVVVFGQGNVDRSPCGTGTCAKLALLHKRGLMSLKKPYRHEGVLGTTFTGQIVGVTMVDDRPAVIPRVTGRAFITGMSQFLVDHEDPFKHGFMLEGRERRNRGAPAGETIQEEES